MGPNCLRYRQYDRFTVSPGPDVGIAGAGMIASARAARAALTTKAVNLPAWKKVSIDMVHIADMPWSVELPQRASALFFQGI